MTNADTVSFTSTLSEAHRDELERLLFFNANQARASEGVAYVAERYGIPRINVAGPRLCVEVASGTATQALFAVERHGPQERPVGIAIYTREASELVVLFVAVHEDHAMRGGRGLLLEIVAELKRIAGCVRGIDTLVLFVGRRDPTRIRLPKR